MIKIYRRTATINAEQLDGSNEMIDKYHVRCDSEYMLSDDPLEYSTVPYQMETLEGFLNINVDDWIATGVNGEHWTIANDIFKKTYTELPVIPEAVADWIKKCKKNAVSIGGAMNEPDLPEKVADYFRKYYTREQWIEIQDTFARAWLDGYVVEGNK